MDMLKLLHRPSRRNAKIYVNKTLFIFGFSLLITPEKIFVLDSSSTEASEYINVRETSCSLDNSVIHEFRILKEKLAFT
jgi:hypothetical protein